MHFVGPPRRENHLILRALVSPVRAIKYIYIHLSKIERAWTMSYSFCIIICKCSICFSIKEFKCFVNLRVCIHPLKSKISKSKKITFLVSLGFPVSSNSRITFLSLRNFLNLWMPIIVNLWEIFRLQHK